LEGVVTTSKYSNPTYSTGKHAIIAAYLAHCHHPTTYCHPFTGASQRAPSPYRSAEISPAVVRELQPARSDGAKKLAPEITAILELAARAGLPPLTPLELLRVARLPEAARLTGISEDGLRRYHADKIIHLSPRAVGMRIYDVLAIGAANRVIR
jgi:hypothetical protein